MKGKYFQALFLLFVLTIGRVEGWSLDPNVTPDKYLTRHWTIRDGLPHNTVTAIVQDNDGFLWFGTDNGVTRFDGDNFEIFNTLNTKEIKSNAITSLLVASDQTIWIGTHGGGITRYYPHAHQFKNYSISQGLSSNSIHSLSRSPDGNIWIGTDGGGLIQYDGNHFRVFSKNYGLSYPVIPRVFCSRDNGVWVGTERGLNYFSKGKFFDYTIVEGLGDSRIDSIYEDRKNTLWIASDGIIHKLNKIPHSKAAPQLTVTDNIDVSEYSGIYHILEDGNGIIWAATDTGLKRIIYDKSSKPKSPQNPRIETISTGIGLTPETPVISIFLDNSGTLWAGTLGNGLNSLKNTKFKYYTTSDGLSSNYVNVVYGDNKNNIWIGTRGWGLNLLKDEKITIYTKKDGLSSNHITTLSLDNEDNLWVGTAEGLNVKTGNSFRKLPLNEELSKEFITVLYLDIRGNLWIGTRTGLRAFNSGHFYIPYSLDLSRDFEGKTVLCMTQEISENLWVGTHRGLYYLQGNRFIVLPGGDKLSRYMIRDIYRQPGKVLWLGTDAGLLHYDIETGKISEYPKPSEFSTAGVYKIFDDHHKNIWFSSNKGLFCLPSIYTRNDNIMGTSSEPARYYHFLESDGLRTAIFTGDFQPAGWKDPDGIVWLPSASGLVSLYPPLVKTATISIPVKIEYITANGKRIIPSLRNNPTYIPSPKKVVFYFHALNLNGFENLQFKCKLEHPSGSDNKVFETTLDHSRNRISFENLEYGRYRFSIKAGNEDKGWSSRETEFFFYTGSGLPLSEKLLLIFVMLFAICIVIVFKIREKRNKEKEMMKIFQDDQRYKTSAMDHKKIKKYTLQIVTLMEKEKLYLDPEISVTSLGQKIGIPKEHISQVINQRFHMNFNQFLNKYRIEEAKKRLMDPKENQFVVLKIGYDVGFNSKSTFNAAFKKFTGMSPSEYREKFQPSAQKD